MWKHDQNCSSYFVICWFQWHQCVAHSHQISWRAQSSQWTGIKSNNVNNWSNEQLLWNYNYRLMRALSQIISPTHTHTLYSLYVSHCLVSQTTGYRSLWCITTKRTPFYRFDYVLWTRRNVICAHLVGFIGIPNRISRTNPTWTVSMPILKRCFSSLCTHAYIQTLYKQTNTYRNMEIRVCKCSLSYWLRLSWTGVSFYRLNTYKHTVHCTHWYCSYIHLFVLSFFYIYFAESNELCLCFCMCVCVYVSDAYDRIFRRRRFFLYIVAI